MIWKVSRRSGKFPDDLMHKILQNHLLCAFVANLKIDALYPESFCYKNLAIRKILAFCDSEADGAQTFEEKYVSCFVFESCTSCGSARCTRCRYGREVVKGESAGNHSSKWPTIESAIKEPFVTQRYFRPIKLLFRMIFLS